MKKTFLSTLMISLLFLPSCNDDDVKAPEIEITELGYENSGIAYAGNDLHIDAEILAEGKIENVRLTIHAAEDHLEEGNEHAEWQVDSTYTTGFTGLKNSDFHEHIDVPADAEEVEYHLHLYATDMEGNQSSEEALFEVVYDAENEHNHEH